VAVRGHAQRIGHFVPIARIPDAVRLVGTGVHTYDAFPRAPYQSTIPPMRTPQESVGGSCTPIYDALCSEYRRLFRALPFDRTGEENLQLHALMRGWQSGYGNGRHREQPPALPPGTGSGHHDNRMRGL
jgi:hypothetical protein